MSWNDFNDADVAGDVIPDGEIVKVVLKIRPGGVNDAAQGWTDDMATRSAKTGAVYLDCVYTVSAGKHAKRKVFDLIGLHSPKGPIWGNMGRSTIRAILESARGIQPNDMGEIARSKRAIDSLQELDGLEFCIEVAVEEQTGFDPRNRVKRVITPAHRRYQEVMAGGGAPTSMPNGAASAPAPAGMPAAWQE